MTLTPDFIQKTKHLPTPFIVIDLEQLQRNYQTMKKNLPMLDIYYAMKANDHPRILEILAKEGSGFEIASPYELEAVQKYNVPAEKIVCYNPIKTIAFLKAMDKAGVKIMAFDSKDEVDKIATYAPQSELVIRVNVDNDGSEWPLTSKFGVDTDEALPLLRYAKKKNLNVIGITFHVGSQALNKNTWTRAMNACKPFILQAQNEGFDLRLMSLGGGIPTKHTKDIPTMQEIGESITTEIADPFWTEKAFTFSIEPGRGLIGDTAIMGTSVIGKAKRGNDEWIYIDVGVYNGLLETIENFTYELAVENPTTPHTVTIAGPSCDSIDIPFMNVPLAKVAVNDRIYVINAGAYTSAITTHFNGFDGPTVYFTDANNKSPQQS